MQGFSVKEIARNCGKSFLTCLVVFCALMAIAGCVPVDAIKSKLIESSNIIAAEGDYAQLQAYESNQQLDNFTSGIMLRIMACDKSQGPLNVFLANYYYDGSSPTSQNFETEAFSDAGVELISYARYWHGWVVLYKPLSIFFNINQIRAILFMTIMLLIAANCAVLGRKEGLLPALAFAGAYTTASLVAVAYTLAFAPTFIISLVGCLIVAMRKSKKLPVSLFFCLGAVTTYVDLLDNPIISLGAPLALMVYLQRNDGLSAKKQLLSFVILCIAWGLGFGLLWVSKWIITAPIFDGDIFKDALGTAKEHTSTSIYAHDYNGINSSWFNFKAYFPDWTLIALVLVTVAFLVGLLVVSQRTGKVEFTFNTITIVLLIVVAFLPIAWFCVMVEHSIIHWWFTCRNYVVSIFAYFLALASLCKTK